MKFIMFIRPDRRVQLDPDQKAAIPAAVGRWVAEMDARGVRLQGHVLGPFGDAATIRVRDGRTIIGTGPVGTADDQITGFNILECADLDEAIEVTSKHPVATFGTLELRPFAES